MNRLIVAFVAIALAAPAAHAQTAEALGRPLPAGDLPSGTLMVRVVAGDFSQPAVGIDVTAATDGFSRTARTDGEGRATIPGVPAGIEVIVSVAGDGATTKSQPITMPASGGVRVMLSTKPLAQTPESMGKMAGAGGMPKPREMSGQARPERDPAGTLTIRVLYNNFNRPAPRHPVHLVAYRADDSISMLTASTDSAGRVVFPGLDVSGATAYFALTILPRDQVQDRLMSAPVLPDGSSGLRMMLSGEELGGSAPPVDDLTEFEEQVAPPPGRVVVGLDGLVQEGNEVRLIDASRGTTIAAAAARAPVPIPGSLRSQLGTISADTTKKAGALTLSLVRRSANGTIPVEGTTVVVREAGAVEGRTAVVSGGTATVDGLAAGKKVEAVITYDGEKVVTASFDLPAAGGAAGTVLLDWKSRGRLEATFDQIPSDPAQVLVVEVLANGQTYRSMPFQTVTARGSRVSVTAFPRVLFTFRLQSAAEDEYFGVQGLFEVQNWSWFPYRASPDGMVVDLPQGFTGAVIFDEREKELVTPDAKGFRIRRPLPPGGLRFHGGFSLPVRDGNVDWDLALPLGTYGSAMQVRKVPGMEMDLPQDKDESQDSRLERVSKQTVTGDDGSTYIVLQPISIMPKQRMVMRLHGLPMQPAWQTWVPRVVGILVLILVIGGVAFALAGRGKPLDAATSRRERRARIDALYEELVALEKRGDESGRRAEVIAELERVLGEDLARDEAATRRIGS